MAINWGMAGQGNNALAYFQMGQQMGQSLIDGRVNKALGRVLTGGAQTPGMPSPAPMAQGAPSGMGGGVVATPEQQAETARMQALYPNAPQFAQDARTNALDADMQTIARHNPQLFMQLQQRQAQAEEATRKRQQEQVAAQRTRLTETAKLFEGVTPENYGQRLAVAQQLGIDTSGAPQTYDSTWVQQNAQIMRFAADNPDKLPMIAQEFQAAGIDLNTPQGKQALLNAIAGKYGTDYADESGNIRRRAAFDPKSFAQPNIPDGAIAELKANPATAAQFDEIFGPGASSRVLGGQPAGNGPFAP